MASILYSREVSDLVLGKPKLKEFHYSRSVKEALDTLIELNDFELPVWRLPRKSSERSGANAEKYESPQAKEERFVGMLSMLDIMDHLASEASLGDPIGALNVSVADIMTPDSTLLKCVAPGTRLMDALGLIKGGTRRLLVPLSSGSQPISKRFSRKSSFGSRWFIPPNLELILSKPDKPVGYYCVTFEDVARYLLGCLGALAPFPLTSINSQGIINTSPPVIHFSDPAKKALKVWHEAPPHIQAVAVVQELEGRQVLVGEISAIKLIRCGLRVALVLATLSASDFVAYVEHYGDSSGVSKDEILWSKSVIPINHQREFSSFRSRIMPLSCRPSNSVAAVMAQMLAYRITHVWVTEEDGTLFGIVTYPDIMAALTAIPISMDKRMANVIAKDVDRTVELGVDV